MLVEAVEKVDTCQSVIEKVETYVNWFKKSRALFLLGRESRNIPKLGRENETYENLVETFEHTKFLSRKSKYKSSTATRAVINDIYFLSIEKSIRPVRLFEQIACI